MAAKRSHQPLPSAQARTVSLFTGKADIDDREPGRARDGTPSEMPRKHPTRKSLKWEGGITRWAVTDGPHGESYVIVKDPLGYHASHFHRSLGTYPDILQAGDACEIHYGGPLRVLPSESVDR